jgi:hypothetical protein
VAADLALLASVLADLAGVRVVGPRHVPDNEVLGR